MAFYYEKEQLYVETNDSGVGLGASVLQAKDDLQFPSNEAPGKAVLWPVISVIKSLTSAETHHSNIEREALGIPHGLEKFHEYCFTFQVRMVIDHKLLVAIFKKDVESISI